MTGGLARRAALQSLAIGPLALWAGGRTAFVDAASGRLVMMPHCSRLVDDGKRLWCNEVDGATAYSYAGRRLVRVHGPRLAFPDDDGTGQDRNRPVFLDDDGAAVSWRGPMLHRTMQQFVWQPNLLQVAKFLGAGIKRMQAIDPDDGSNI